LAVIAPNTPVDEMRETSSDPALSRAYGAFFSELRRLGYIEGQNLIVERYSGEGRVERFRELTGSVVRGHPDVIYTFSPEVVLAFKAAATSIPLVAITDDPVALGFASSLAHPGGNITGVIVDAGPEIAGKRLELLREALPKMLKLGVLITRNEAGARQAPVLNEASKALGITLVGSPLDRPLDEPAYRRAFEAMAREGADAVFVSDEPEHFPNQRMIVVLAREARLPAMYPFREAVEAGGLMAYTFELLDLMRHNADQVALIFNGSKPGEIPFYRARKFDLIVNLKTAKELGIAIPSSLLAQANEVIE
jgi:putative ABC transport system substrate-binding protein